jgi:hypothetical protein
MFQGPELSGTRIVILLFDGLCCIELERLRLFHSYWTDISARDSASISTWPRFLFAGDGLGVTNFPRRSELSCGGQ